MHVQEASSTQSLGTGTVLCSLTGPRQQLVLLLELELLLLLECCPKINMGVGHCEDGVMVGPCMRRKLGSSGSL